MKASDLKVDDKIRITGVPANYGDAFHKIDLSDKKKVVSVTPRQGFDMCIGCNGRLGWYSEDNGQWVSCLHCPEGRAKFETDKKNLEETRKICDASLERLRQQLSTKSVGNKQEDYPL